MTVRQLYTSVVPHHRQHRLRSPWQPPRVRRTVRRRSQPAAVSFQRRAQCRLLPRLRRHHSAPSPPTSSQRKQSLRSLIHRHQLRAHPLAPHLSSPHHPSLTLRRSSETSPTPSFPPLQSRAAATSSHSRPAPMTVRQLYTFVMPHHRQHRLRSPWQLPRVRRRAE
jgi:hypothetical protein